jgi:BirA family biotin operon repressor/biotin-[acetyl-CoA-carboxylase] ligase
MLAIGIGVNLIAAPPPRRWNPAPCRRSRCWAETGLRLTPEAFSTPSPPPMPRGRRNLPQGGFAPLRTAWLAHAARLGERSRARTGTDTAKGVFETVDAAALILAIPAGRVFF